MTARPQLDRLEEASCLMEQAIGIVQLAIEQAEAEQAGAEERYICRLSNNGLLALYAAVTIATDARRITNETHSALAREART